MEGEEGEQSEEGKKGEGWKLQEAARLAKRMAGAWLMHEK